MASNEKTSARVARIAAKILDGYKPTLAEIRSVAGSVLTQVRDRKKSAYYTRAGMKRTIARVLAKPKRKAKKSKKPKA